MSEENWLYRQITMYEKECQRNSWPTFVRVWRERDGDDIQWEVITVSKMLGQEPESWIRNRFPNRKLTHLYSMRCREDNMIREEFPAAATLEKMMYSSKLDTPGYEPEFEAALWVERTTKHLNVFAGVWASKSCPDY